MHCSGPLLVVRERRNPARLGPLPDDSELPDLDDWLLRQPRYSASFGRILELSREFEGALTADQRSNWLFLEEALFEHFQLMKEAYYRIGRHSGRIDETLRAGKAGLVGKASTAERTSTANHAETAEEADLSEIGASATSPHYPFLSGAPAGDEDDELMALLAWMLRRRLGTQD